MDTADEDRELELAKLLVEYETQLAMPYASTHAPLSIAGALPDELALLERAKRGLLRLERLWPHEQPPEERIPQAIGRFRIIRELGRGGFGIVYLAHDEALLRQVALKVQRPDALVSPSLRERFAREAKAAARLECPQIAGVYDVGEEGVRIWIASEYVAGESLAAWLRTQTRAVAPKAAAHFVALLADALQYAHAQGVLHRDLKPSNVLLEETPSRHADHHELSRYAPKLIDFGLARLDEDSRLETRTGVLIGTPPYMSPEQASGQVRAIGPATDVYGLGTILFELLTGRAAFGGASDVATLRQVVEDDPIAPRKLQPAVPADLEAIALACLEKDPAKRYATAGGLGADLRRFLAGQPTLARPLTRRERLAKWVRRQPALAALVAVSLAGTILLLFGALAYVAQLRGARNEAEILQAKAEASQADADRSAEAAREQQEIASRYLYVSRMRLACELLDRGDWRAASELVRAYEPASSEAGRRGFEWYHLKRRLHRARITLAHGGEVYTVAYSPDGRVLASGGNDGKIRLWDPAEGQLLATLEGHAGCVNQIAYTPDGATLISVSCDHTVKLWDATTHDVRQTLRDHQDEVLCLAIAPDGAHFASAGRRTPVLVHDLSGKVVREFDLNCPSVDSVAWLDSHSVVAPCAKDGATVSHVICNLVTGQAQRTPPVPLVGRSLAIPPAGGAVVTGMTDGTVRTIPELSEHVVELPGRNWMATALAFSSRSDWLAAGYDDSTVQLANWPQANVREVLPGHTGRVQAVAFIPAGDELATASHDGTVKLWTLRFESVPRLELDCYAPVRSGSAPVSALSADLKLIALPTALDQVEVFDVEQNRRLARLHLAEPVQTLRFSRDEPEVLIGADMHEVWKWNWKREERESIAAIPAKAVEKLMLSDDGRHLVIQEDLSASIYDVRAKQIWHTVGLSNDAAPALSIQCAPDGRTCLLMCEYFRRRDHFLVDGRSEWFDLESKKSLGPGSRTCYAIGRKFWAVGGEDNSIKILDRASGHTVSRFTTSVFVPQLLLFPDERTVAVDDRQAMISLWNVASGQFLGGLKTDGSRVAQLCCAANGRGLAAILNLPAEPSDGGMGHFRLRVFVWSAADEP